MIQEIELMELAQLAIPLLMVGIAWGVAAQKAKGQDARLDSHSRDLRDHIREDKEIHKELLSSTTRLHTKLDMLLKMPRSD